MDNADQIEQHRRKGKMLVGVTASASTPELLVQEVMDHLRASGLNSVSEHGGKRKNIVFSLPKVLS